MDLVPCADGEHLDQQSEARLSAKIRLGPFKQKSRTLEVPDCVAGGAEHSGLDSRQITTRESSIHAGSHPGFTVDGQREADQLHHSRVAIHGV